MKKVLDTTPPTRPPTSDQEIWNYIVFHIDNEIKVKEPILLYNKCHSSKTDRKGDTKDGRSSESNYLTFPKDKKCLICGKTDHVPTITKNGNPIINYFACDKFAKLSPREQNVFSVFDSLFQG